MNRKRGYIAMIKHEHEPEYTNTASQVTSHNSVPSPNQG